MRITEILTEAKATKQRLDPKCWKGKHKEGTKVKGGVRVNNCVPNESVAEGSLEANTPNPVVVVQDLKGKILDKVNLSMAVQKYKLGNPQDIKNQLAHQNYTQIGNYIIVSPMSGQPQDATTQGVAEAIPLDTLRSTAGTRVKDKVSAKLKQNGPLGRDAEKAKQNGKPVKPGVAEAGSPAQQAAIAINMKKHHKKPKNEDV